jgi:leucyl/phenylalanyl-tRNA--protein transferase
MADIIDPALLLMAYRSGIFPMADARDDPDVFWVEPKRRGILPLYGFHCSHSLTRVLRRGRFAVTCNADFAGVMRACAAPRPSEGGQTWISERIEASYIALHEAGHAHSVECWLDGALVGGLYGVGFDRVFCGESMFSRVADASKVALAWTVVALRRAGVELLDCQFLTDHLASMGAVEVSQQSYLAQLRHAQRGDQSGAGASGAGAAESLPSAFAGFLAAAKSAGFSSSPGKLIAQSLTQTS